MKEVLGCPHSAHTSRDSDVKLQVPWNDTRESGFLGKGAANRDPRWDIRNLDWLQRHRTVGQKREDSRGSLGHALPAARGPAREWD